MADSAPATGPLVALAAGIAERRLATTGFPLEQPDFNAWRLEVRSEADFISLVSNCYKWWRESWRDDIQFLGENSYSRAKSAPLWEFTSLLRHLRTAQQHSDNAASVAFAERWLEDACGVGRPESSELWRACGLALGRAMLSAVTALSDLAEYAAVKSELADTWKRRVSALASADAVIVRARVADDLGLNLPTRVLPHIDRQIDYEWRVRIRTASDDPAAALTSVVERILLGRSLVPLPCSYPDILDLLDCWAAPDAAGAVRLAHVVAELANYANDREFLDLVADIWRRLHE